MIALYSLPISSRLIFWALSFVTVLYGILDWKRLQDPQLNAWFCNSILLQRLVLRKEEKREKLTSSLFFLIGSTLTVFLFSRPVAALAILYLCWCDPAANIFGKAFAPPSSSKRRPVEPDSTSLLSWITSYRFSNNKSLVGSLAAAAVGLIVTLLFLICTTASTLELSLLSYAWRLILTSVAGGVFAALGEGCSFGSLDDNLTMPLVSAFLLTLFSPIEALYLNSI